MELVTPISNVMVLLVIIVKKNNKIWYVLPKEIREVWHKEVYRQFRNICVLLELSQKLCSTKHLTAN
jgi:hypothetical protein